MSITFYSRVNRPKTVLTKPINVIFREREKVKDVKVIDKDNDLYEIVEKFIVTKEVNLTSLTNSYKGQTGLEAVMKRVAITGDISLLNTITTDKDSVFDATSLPKSYGEAVSASKKIEDIYSKIPDDLKNGMSVEDFISSITAEAIEAYVKKVSETKEVKDNE